MANDTLQDIRDDVDSILAASASMAQRRMGNIPATATPFGSANTTAIDGTTPRAIRAAVASKKKWITWAIFLNGTVAEAPLLVVEDDTAVTPLRLAMGAPGGTVTTTSGAAGMPPAGIVQFDPPIPVAAGKAINGRAIASCTGAFIACGGFEEA